MLLYECEIIRSVNARIVPTCLACEISSVLHTHRAGSGYM